MRSHEPLRNACRLVLALAVLGAGASGGGDWQEIRGDDNGLIRRGPFMLCGDDEGMLHLLYRGRPLIHGMGVFCGLNGYTVPRDLAMEEVVRAKGTVTYRGKVRGHDVVFEQTASIAGNRIRVQVSLTGDWPEDVWGSFQIRLPLSRYGGARYRADDEVHTFPETYSPDHGFPGGAARLECHLDEPALNLLFECADGIGISDHRRFRAPYYVLGIGTPRGDRETVEFFITLPHLPDVQPRRAVRWSRIGYPIAGEKFVVLEWSQHAERPDDWARLENRRGQVVKEGRFGQTQTADYIQGNYAAFDFSELREPGDYRVLWSGGSSDWFPIRRSVFEDRLWQPTLDYFIPFQMCHADVHLGEAVTGHPACHGDDGARVPAQYHGPDGFVSYECEDTPYEAGEHVLCALGGWHDAGDHDLNVPAQSFVTWTLALAYEEFGIDRDVATLDVEAQTFTTGRPDGVPDILQQVQWGALWLLTMQQEDGRVYNGICANSPQRNGGKPLGTVTDGRPGTGDERQVYVDYHADQQLNYAIAMAAASRVLKEVRPQLAERCGVAARRAFAYFQDSDEVYRRGSYTASEVRGKERDASVMAAAIELYLTGGDGKYLDVASGLAGSLPELELDWPLPRATGTGGFRYLPPFLARLHPLLPDGELKQTVLATCRRAAEKKAQRLGVRPWPFNWWHFGQWGNTGTCTGRAFDVYWLSRLAPDVLPPESPLRNMLWIFGLHPTCDTVFVCGLGFPEPQHHYSSHLHALFGYGPASVPGAVVPGMGGFWRSGVIAYTDEHGYYGHNEACIYTAAQYIFAVNAMKEAGY